MSTDIYDSLKMLGLTRYEIAVYIALLAQEGATAMEIHELSGVPRASVYPIIDRLSQKGLVSISNTSPRRFNGVPPDRGIDLLLGRIEEHAERARERLRKIFESRRQRTREVQETIWSLSGDDVIVARLCEMIRGARRHVLLATAWPFIRDSLLPAIRETEAEVEIYTGDWDPEVEEVSNIHLYSWPHTGTKVRALHATGACVIDRSAAMVFFHGENGATALYSESPGFLAFLGSYTEILKASRKRS
ncbi:MAG: TrmB family transcriptional regulator [Methanoculleaceae archaeon]